MSDGKTHYEVLGLPRDASLEQIKRRYRELARRYHPDLNRDRPETHEIFLRINQAYEVLSDPSRRAAYDLDLRDRERREAERRAGAFGSAPFSAAGVRPGPAAYSPRTGSPPPRAASYRAAAAARRLQEAERLADEARLFYLRGNLREAERRCREALEQSRLAPAYDLLGDICSRQGRIDEAIEHYTVAAQLTPANGLIMAKLNRLLERQQARPVGRSAGVPVRRQRRSAYRAGITCFGLSVILLLMFWWPGVEGARLEWPILANWTALQLVCALLSGFLGGAMLAAAGWIRPIDQELFFPAVGSPRRPVPLFLILGLFGAMFLPLALVIYLIVALFQESLSRSILALFGLAFLLALGFAVVTPTQEARVETLFFGGNLFFVSALAGWFFGDLFRPGWSF